MNPDLLAILNSLAAAKWDISIGTRRYGWMVALAKNGEYFQSQRPSLLEAVQSCMDKAGIDLVSDGDDADESQS